MFRGMNGHSGSLLISDDNLAALSGLATGTVDLVYLDPPFNSDRDYHTRTGELAFRDSWDSLSCYLAHLRVRLIELRRVLKQSGSIYLHCDPTASHYIKILLDEVFGRRRFRNEIVWCYSGGGIPRQDFPRKHDTLLRYSKSSSWTFNVQRKPYKRNTQDVGIHSTRSGKRNKIDLGRGTPVTDWWVDIPTTTGWSGENVGYPTQKPLRLLERIINASSDPGDLVLDPYCGSGTTLVAAERLGRRWIGIDDSPVAIRVARERLGEPQQCRLAV